jgi:hypothetical protein
MRSTLRIVDYRVYPVALSAFPTGLDPTALSLVTALSRVTALSMVKALSRERR